MVVMEEGGEVVEVVEVGVINNSQIGGNQRSPTTPTTLGRPLRVPVRYPTYHILRTRRQMPHLRRGQVVLRLDARKASVSLIPWRLPSQRLIRVAVHPTGLTTLLRTLALNPSVVMLRIVQVTSQLRLQRVVPRLDAQKVIHSHRNKE